MNKILIVGHPESGYREVESLLNACGMNRARPSRREDLTAEEIDTMLCKAHKAGPLNELPADRAIAQIEAGPVWHGMALDLILGNIDQELWGWADPSSVYLLDYWKSLDQNITFILVYNSPETLLGSSEQTGCLSEEELQQRVHVWQAYNAALLHFYYRNTERCLLVHAEQVRHSANNYLQQVRARIGAPLAELKHLTITENDDIALHEQGNEYSILDTDAAEASASSIEVAMAGGTSFKIEEHQAFVASPPADETALEQHLAQAVVSQQPQVLQLYAELQSAANLPLASDAVTGIPALAAWRGLAALRAQGQQKLLQAENDKKSLADEVAAANDRLQFAQEELSRNTQEIERLTRETAASAEQLAEQLVSQSKLAESTREQQRENELILIQLHQVQEELERFHLEAQQHKEKIKALQEAEKRAAERDRENEALNKQLEKQAEIIQGHEAELKKVLPAPAINPEMQQENELLLRQLHQVQEELERYYIENQRLKTTPAVPAKQPKPVYYGAADRVKAQLSYRLGYLMVQRSRTVGGLVTLPWALFRETQQFRRMKLQKSEKLPPLHQYRDAHEADKAKQHLSYRLGSALIAHAKSPIGWTKLPFVFRREIKEFRQQRNVKGRIPQ